MFALAIKPLRTIAIESDLHAVALFSLCGLVLSLAIVSFGG